MPKVLLTRPQIRSNEQDTLHQTLSGAGVTIAELPMLNFALPKETTELDNAIQRAARGEYDIIVLSSPTAVEFMEAQATELGLLDTLKANGRFAVVGPGTSDALSKLGMTIVLPIPPSGGSHQLMALLASQNLSGKRILLLQSQLGLEVLDHAFAEVGAITERVTLYITKGPTLGDSARLLLMLEDASRPDVIAFFSPSSVMFFIRSLAEMASGLLRNLPALACIGETTAKAVEEGLHRRPEIVARKADQQSLAQDILQYLNIQQS